MRYSTVIFFAALLLVGCQTRKQQTAVVQPFPQDKRLVAIYDELKKVAIPLPQTTPFDDNSRRRGSYLAGFREGWDFAISGRILYGTQIAPAGMESDLFSAWQDGACEGRRYGSEQLVVRLDLRK
jgi:hypothetical protein